MQPDSLLLQNGEAKTLGDTGDFPRRRAGGELEHHFVGQKPRFANGRHTRPGRQRYALHVNEARAGRRAIAALQPVREAAWAKPNA